MERNQSKAIKRMGKLDIVIFILLTMWGLLILIPFMNVVAVSFTTQKEYADSTILIIPMKPTLKNYIDLMNDGRILIGYRTTLLILLLGIPMNLLLTTSFAYGLSRPEFPGRKFFFYVVLITMLFNGGVIPIYVQMKDMGLTNKIWSIILVYGINTFYMIIMRNYFMSLPESLIESARLDGAREWQILLRIILPLSMPIMATITLFYTVDRWNEWYYAMLFIRKNTIQPLQLVLRSIVIDSQVLSNAALASTSASADTMRFTMGLKTAAVIVTILPVMCVFPFLQKHFIKGVLIGAVKS